MYPIDCRHPDAPTAQPAYLATAGLRPRKRHLGDVFRPVHISPSLCDAGAAIATQDLVFGFHYCAIKRQRTLLIQPVSSSAENQ